MGLLLERLSHRAGHHVLLGLFLDSRDFNELLLQVLQHLRLIKLHLDEFAQVRVLSRVRSNQVPEGAQMLLACRL